MHWFFKFSLGLLVLIFFWMSFNYILPKVLGVENVANKSVNGLIWRNQNWSGTITVVGDLITTPGVTVTVAPGTKIVVNKDGDKSNFNYLPWDLKAGLNTGPLWHGIRNGELFWDESQKIDLRFSRLNAIGTDTQPIIITSNAPTNQDSPYDFNIIGVEKGVLGHILASDYRRLEIGDSVTVRDSQFEKVVECAICANEGQPSIINNVFKSSLRQAILAVDSSPKITDNLFLNDTTVGVRVDPNRFGSPIISNNDFEMPTQTAVEFLTGDEDHGGVISFNRFEGGTKIKIPCDSKVNLVENDLQGALLTFQVGGCGETLMVGPNYWGTSNSATVLSERVVKTDQNLVVQVPTLLKSLPPHIGRRN